MSNPQHDDDELERRSRPRSSECVRAGREQLLWNGAVCAALRAVADNPSRASASHACGTTHGTRPPCAGFRSAGQLFAEAGAGSRTNGCDNGSQRAKSASPPWQRVVAQQATRCPHSMRQQLQQQVRLKSSASRQMEPSAAAGRAPCNRCQPSLSTSEGQGDGKVIGDRFVPSGSSLANTRSDVLSETPCADHRTTTNTPLCTAGSLGSRPPRMLGAAKLPIKRLATVVGNNARPVYKQFKPPRRKEDHASCNGLTASCDTHNCIRSGGSGGSE